MTVFDDCKDAITMPEVAGFYGFTPNRANFICCPFHREKTPSMKLYSRTFHCFGCLTHGSVIDFTARLFDLDAIGAVKRLNEDFHLGLSLDRPPDPDQLRQRKKLQETQQRFNVWRELLLNQIDRAIRVANNCDYLNVTDSEALAIRFREALEAWADDLLHGNLDIQMQIFRDREGVERICRKILSGTQKKSTAA